MSKNSLTFIVALLFAHLAVLALPGCGEATARPQRVEGPPPAHAVIADSPLHPTADANADNGPGCDESALGAGDAPGAESASRPRRSGTETPRGAERQRSSLSAQTVSRTIFKM